MARDRSRDEKPPRASRSARRERAQATRRRMLDAAYELFSQRGYNVPLTEVAERAGVAVQTVYFTFHNKAALMGAVLTLAVLGDDLPLAPHERPWFRKLEAEPDPRKALRHMVEGTAAIFRRVSPLLGVFQSADPELTELWEHSEKLRIEAFRSPVMKTLATKGRLRRGLDVDAAADVLFVLLSPAMYREIVMQRSWPEERWRKWIGDLIADALFESPA